jgi:hypothetical protein
MTTAQMSGGAHRPPMLKACMYCGCTDTNACETAAGPCHWVCEEPPICSSRRCIAQGHADHFVLDVA